MHDIPRAHPYALLAFPLIGHPATCIRAKTILVPLQTPWYLVLLNLWIKAAVAKPVRLILDGYDHSTSRKKN